MAYRPLFVVGCPRSGTTWVQLLLNQSSLVATAPETHIFSFYLVGFRRQWRQELTGPAATLQGGAGLSRLLSEDDFKRLCRRTAEQVLDRIAESRRGAVVVAEKSPQHALLARWIAELFPEARFLHVVRDPRDTVVSIAKAARTWGRGWAPANPLDGARMWRDHVIGARELVGATERYRELRYEDLKRDPAVEFGRLLEWLGIPESPPFLERAVAACNLERLSQADGASLPTPGRVSPPGFFGGGKVGGYRTGLGRSATRAVELVCGDLMAAYGYERATRGGFSLRLGLHSALLRIRESLDWQLQRLANRI